MGCLVEAEAEHTADQSRPKMAGSSLVGPERTAATDCCSVGVVDTETRYRLVAEAAADKTLLWVAEDTSRIAGVVRTRPDTSFPGSCCCSDAGMPWLELASS